MSTNKALFSNEPYYSSLPSDNNLPNPGEQPVSVTEVTKGPGGELDFHISNDCPVDLELVTIYTRYYGPDLTEVLDTQIGDIDHLPAGQKGHVRVYAPIHISGYSCVQYDIRIPGYPTGGVTFQKTFLTCDFK